MESSLRERLRDFVLKYELLFILILAAFIRILFFVGVQLGDDLAYLGYVNDLLKGDFRLPVNHWETRVGLIVPVYFFSKLFGLNEYTIALFPFLCSLINVFLVYRISKYLFSRKIAIISAVLLSFFPLELYYSTSVYPTVPLSTMCGLSAYLLIKNRNEKRNSQYFWSGLFLGLAYLIHDIGLFFGLFLILQIIFLTSNQKVRRMILLSLGILLVIAVEVGVYSIVADNPLYRINIENRTISLNLPKEHTGVSTTQDKGRSSFLKDSTSQVLRGNNFWIEPLLTLTTQQEFGLYYYIIIPVTFYFLARRKKIEGVNLMLLWLIPVTLYLFYGSVSPFEYRPLRRWPRYFSLASFPGIILISVLLEELLASSKKVAANLLISLLVLSSLAIVTVDNWHRYAVVQRNVGNYIKTHEGIYFAHKTLRNLVFFVDYDTNRLKRFEEDAVKGEKLTGGAYVVYSDKNPISGNYPMVGVFETPRNIFVELAVRIGLPDIVVSKLWRKETYFIARIY
jgi:hypothetical protein